MEWAVYGIGTSQVFHKPPLMDDAWTRARVFSSKADKRERGRDLMRGSGRRSFNNNLSPARLKARAIYFDLALVI